MNPALILPLLLAAGLFGVCVNLALLERKAPKGSRDYTGSLYFGFFVALILIVCGLVQLNSN